MAVLFALRALCRLITLRAAEQGLFGSADQLVRSDGSLNVELLDLALCRMRQQAVGAADGNAMLDCGDGLDLLSDVATHKAAVGWSDNIYRQQVVQRAVLPLLDLTRRSIYARFVPMGLEDRAWRTRSTRARSRRALAKGSTAPRRSTWRTRRG